MRKFEDSLPMLLLRAREAAMAGFRPLLAAHGLTEQQWRVLRLLHEHDGMEARALAERALILPPSMSGILDRLERDGHVRREPSEHDGRKVHIRTTGRARRLYRKLAPLIEARYAELQARFTEAGWRQLHESLATLVDSAAEHELGAS